MSILKYKKSKLFIRIVTKFDLRKKKKNNDNVLPLYIFIIYTTYSHIYSNK